MDDDSDGTEDGLEDSYYAYLNNYFVLERSVVFSRNKYINLNTIYFTYQDRNLKRTFFVELDLQGINPLKNVA